MAAWLDRHMPAPPAGQAHRPAAQVSDRPRAGSGRSEAASPTVKVHIGRIRVDGAAKSAPRSRFSRPAPTMALSDYLGRRYKR
jgi:hypothetical protein